MRSNREAMWGLSTSCTHNGAPGDLIGGSDQSVSRSFALLVVHTMTAKKEYLSGWVVRRPAVCLADPYSNVCRTGNDNQRASVRHALVRCSEQGQNTYEERYTDYCFSSSVIVLHRLTGSLVGNHSLSNVA